jgi:hypothetical protein
MSYGDLMGDRPAHIRKAQHNESFLNRELLPQSGYNDWKITAIFYAAVHYIDAGLARMNIHPTDHAGMDVRNVYVSNHFRHISAKFPPNTKLFIINVDMHVMNLIAKIIYSHLKS